MAEGDHVCRLTTGKKSVLGDLAFMIEPSNAEAAATIAELAKPLPFGRIPFLPMTMKPCPEMWWPTRCLAVIPVLFLVLIGPKPATAAEPSIAEACTLTVNDYAWYLDHPGPEPIQSAQDFANLFTRDAELTVPDDNLDLTTHLGHAAIAENYLERLKYSRLLHVTSNIRIAPESRDKAKGTSYLTLYMHATEGSMKDEGAITMVEESRDEYRITADGCKISKRKSIVRMLSTDGIIQAPGPE